MQHAFRGGPGERRLACQHFVEHAAEAVDVAAPIDIAVPRALLRAHVHRGAHRHTGRRQPLAAGGADAARDAEIADDGLPGDEQDVFGFDVAMDDIMGVRVMEGACHLLRDVRGVGNGELLFPREPIPQRFALDVGHDVIEEAVGFPRIVEGEDVRVRESRGDLDFAQEAVGSQRGGELRPQHLDRDGAMMLDVAAEVHGGHATAANFAFERVPPGEGSAQAGE